MKPLLPAPWVTAIAVVLTAALVINIFADGAFAGWDGSQGTYVLGGLVAGILGLPFGIAMFRNQNGPADDHDEKPHDPR